LAERRLLLLRHAKASPDGKDSDDRARELTARGRSNAAAMGAFLQRSAYAPELVLCSSARRTVETCGIVAAELDGTARIEFLDQLYLAPAKKIQSIVRNAAAASVLVIGHNPGIEECAADLARKPANKDEAARLERLKAKYPTCALTVLEFDAARWGDAAAGALAAFVRPKDLE
jgi:phosphohistidine phosphatase